MLLRDLTPQERLDLYKKALPIWIEHPGMRDHCTNRGLCNFFASECVDSYNDLTEKRSNEHLKEWHAHVTSKFKDSLRINDKYDPADRVEALKAMIAQLEEELQNV